MRLAAAVIAGAALLAAEGEGAPGLPLVEIEATSAAPAGDLFAVLLSGDGGWAGLDKGLATYFSQAGVPVVGWNSLKYYWTPRTPEGAADDLAGLVRSHLEAWHKARVLLVGYSMGAENLPFMVRRLPAELRERVALVALVSPGPTAQFEFHLSFWLGGGQGHRARPVEPEVASLDGLHVLCLFGETEDDAPCRAPGASIVHLAGGHHYDGGYAALGQEILSRVGPLTSRTRP